MVPVDPTKVREVHLLQGGRSLLACQVHPSGQYAVAGGMDYQVTQWSIAWDKKQPPLHVGGHQSWVASLAFDPAGKRLYSADYAGLLQCRAFPFQSSKDLPQWSVPAHEGWVRALAISPDGKLLATAGDDRFVRLWSSANGKLVRTLGGHAEMVYQVGFHPGGERLASADLFGVVKDWELASGKLVRDLDAKALFRQIGTGRLGGVRSLTFAADGKHLACGGMSNIGSVGDGIGTATVALFDWTTGKSLLLVPHEELLSFVIGIVFHPAGFIVGATGGFAQGGLLFWKGDQAKSFFKWKMPASGWGLAAHPDGIHLAVAHHDHVLRFYDLSVPKPAK